MQLFSFVLTAFLTFAQQPTTATLPDGYAEEGASKTFEISVITEERANLFFKQIAADTMIPFKSPFACAVNTTVVAQQAEEQSIITGRVRAAGKLMPDTYQNPAYPQANWMMHTASVVYVTKGNGEKQLMVLDPTLAGKPLPIEVWKKMLLGPGGERTGRIDHFYFGTRFQLGMNEAEHKVTEGESEGENSRSEWDEDAVTTAQSAVTGFRRQLFMSELPPPSPAPAPATQSTSGAK